MTWLAFVDQVFFFPWHCHWQKAGSRSLPALSKRWSRLPQWGGPWELALALEGIIETIFSFNFIFTQFLPLVLKVIREVLGDKDIHCPSHLTLICSLHFMILFIKADIHILNKILVSMLLAGQSYHLFLLHSFSCTTTRSVLFSPHAKE